MKSRYLQIWGENLAIKKRIPCIFRKTPFTLQYVNASDDTYAIMFVSYLKAHQAEFSIDVLIRNRLIELDFEPKFTKHNGQLFLEAIQPIESSLRQMFPSYSIGIIILINGLEMGNGVYGLEDMRLKKGDVLQVLYRIAK